MSAPVFLADPTVLAAATPGAAIVIDGPDARHAVTVVRTRVGETVELVDGAGRRVRGIVTAATAPDRLEVEVSTVADEPQPEPRFVVAQAIAKGEHAELAVDLMTQLGVDVILPWQAARSVARWSDEKADRARSKWQAAAVQAAKQSRRARVPQIEPAIGLRELCTRVASAGIAIVLHEQASSAFLDLPLPAAGDVLLIVGPEGGISDEERSALLAAGARQAVLGPTVLRSSLAGAAALTVLGARLRWAAPGMEGSGA